MRQGKTPTRDFAREFERRARDAEMDDEASKVHLVAALHEDTLRNLDAYVTLLGGEEMARLETMPDRLRRITYAQMLSYLKQSNLTDLAKQGAGHTALAAQHEDRRRAGSGAHPVGFGFINAGIMTVDAGRPRRGAPAKTRQARRAGAARAAEETGQVRPKTAAYPLVPIPAHGEHMKALSLALATAQQVLPVDLCTDPLPAMAAVIGLLDTAAANE